MLMMMWSVRETKRKKLADVRRAMTQKPSRNNPCPCGSGKKYKKCCMNTTPIGTNTLVESLHHEYSYHAVAFLDLLGQREIFDDLPDIPDTAIEKARLLDKLKSTIGYIREFRKDFLHTFKVLQEESAIPLEIPAQYHNEYRKLKKTEIHFQNFSDLVMAWTPIRIIDELTMFQAISGLHNIMMVTAIWNLISLASRHPLRGGIDVDCGIAIEPGGDEIYGRALNAAYALEQIAKSPRILIGPGLLQLLSTIESKTESSPTVQGAKKLASMCRGLVALDDDGREILHFLGPTARKIMCNQKYQDVGIVPAVRFVKESVLMFAGDEKLGPRYKRLLRYFEKNAQDWGISI